MVKLMMIEGTPEEVLAVARGLDAGGSAPSGDATAAPLSADSGPEARTFASTEVARKVFNRRPLSPEQKVVVTTLAKRYPNWVPAAELQASTKYTPAQFAGLMGAFGRRFAHTEGFVQGSWLFDAEWNYEKGAYDYKLPDSVYEAAKLEKLI